MHPSDCPGWEYTEVVGHSLILKAAATTQLIRLRRPAFNATAECSDSRPFHLHLFGQLAPAQHPYFAGHYRGEQFRCLQYYRVFVQADPRVGYAPAHVLYEMRELAIRVGQGIVALDAGNALPDAQVPRTEKLIRTVAFAAHIFELFLRIHPYANGNGHVGRFLVVAILARYGFFMRHFSIDPRPPDPPYSNCIKQHRDGDYEPLEKFILRDCLP
jgi:hypothetical protein